MDIKIKTIRSLFVSNLTVLGIAVSIAGCSSTPAPWAQEDDSPWGAKHEAEAKSASSDTSLNDPVLLADSEPEAIVMEEPDAAPAPEVIIPVVVETEPVSQDIMSMLSSNYAVQVFAGNTVESVEKYKSSKDLPDLTTVKTDRSGSTVYVLVDIYPDRATANAAATELEIKTGSKPWVRSLAGLQKIAAP